MNTEKQLQKKNQHTSESTFNGYAGEANNIEPSYCPLTGLSGH